MKFRDLRQGTQFAVLALIAVPICVWVGSLAGCATFDEQWAKTGERMIRVYVTVNDPDAVCRQTGAAAAMGARINGCALRTKQGCFIYLPKDAPQWLVEHEEKHCDGWVHASDESRMRNAAGRHPHSAATSNPRPRARA